MTISRGTRVRNGTAVGRTALIVATAISVWIVVSLVPVPRSAASTPTLNAVGSAEQVYVTGLTSSAKASLITSHGKTLATQKADALGGLLFRNVPPGSGYRVVLSSDGEKSAPITVHTDAAAPWDPSIYNQKISDNGYQYLTTRDGTKLAIDVHPPTDPAGEPGLPPAPRARRPHRLPASVPDAHRILGLRVRGSCRTRERNRHSRQPHGIRGRRRQYARDRLFGWSVQLLRAAAEPRRVRRHRDDRPSTVGP